MNIRTSKCTLRPMVPAGVFATAFLAFAFSAQANVNLVTNGGFESNTGNGQLGFNTAATDWTTGGYNFIFAPGTADTSGANGSFGTIGLWGPGNGSANGLPATSPDGGYYVAADTNFGVGAITQTINGLTVGDTYTLSFYWAGAQQAGFTGPTSEQFSVGLGSQTQSTPVVNIPSEGFSGWQLQTFNYTATSASEVLSFLAGPPSNGAPPFALLDGVSLTQTPEPGYLIPGILGMIAGLGVLRSKKRSKI